MLKLYGDGIHDDTSAIQERIDSGICELQLPAPEKFYLISKPLELPSDFRLVLPRYAEIRLADQSNCVMLRNKMVPSKGRRLAEDAYEKPLTAHIWGYIDDYSPDAPCKNIEISGGIWNFNNQNQIPNPEKSKDFSVREFYGCGMLFYNIENFKLSSMTLKDPSQYGVTLDTVSYFTVKDITFDYNKGNPGPVNMDGIHLDGNCHFGMIQNLKGTCYDDLVAINAHEGSRGPITNIEIDGLFAENCHSAVRLLTVSDRVENIHISNVYGTYYQYCVGLTKYYKGENTGYFDGITLDNIYAAKALPAKNEVFQHPPRVEDCYPLIWIQSETHTKNLAIRDLHRREKTLSKDTIHIAKATVDRLILDNITTENETGEEMPLLHNQGRIGFLSMKRCEAKGDPLIINEGDILSND